MRVEIVRFGTGVSLAANLESALDGL